MTGDTWAWELGGQGIAALLTVMTGVALDLGLLAVEVMEWPNWVVGCVGARPPGPLILLTGVIRCGVTCWVEKQGDGATPRAGCGPGSTLSQSMLLPLPVL